MRAKKFSNDPKVKVVSINDFLISNNFLIGFKNHLWTNEKPEYDNYYFKFTDKYLIYIRFSHKIINYGRDVKDKLEEIQVAYRDGETEYRLFKEKINELQEKKSLTISESSFLKKIKIVEKSLNELFPKYTVVEKKEKNNKKINDYLVDTGYKCGSYKFEKKYLVFDVETNGVRPANDDLLSLSIFDPQTGLCYNRFFPLDLQPLVLTTFIHGINDEMLKDASHMTQDEMNELIDFFDLKNSVLLSYSGGKGLFDFECVNNYCKRQGVNGFDELIFDNIKS